MTHNTSLKALTTLCLSVLILSGCDKTKSLCLNDNEDAKGKWDACRLSCVRKDAASCDKFKSLEASFVKRYSVTPSPDREGLRQTIENIITLREKGKHGPAAAIAKTLELDDPQAFFNAHFEAQVATRLVREYRNKPIKLYALPNALEIQRTTHGRKVILTDLHDKPKDPSSTLLQHLALLKSTKPMKLFTFRLVQEKADNGFALWSFVHDGTGFKYIGKMRQIEEYPPTDDTQIATRDLPMKKVETLLARNPTLLNAELRDAVKKAKRDAAQKTKDAFKKVLTPKKRPDKPTPKP